MSSKTPETTGRGATDFLIDRQDLRRCRFAPAPALEDLELQADDVLLRVAKFGFTANNITYAVVGDMMSYWRFFPAEPGWGRVPVWGFADVIRSKHAGVAEGERVYGYLPMSTHLTLHPDRVTRNGFADVTAHRKGLPAVYNQYVRVAHDPAYDPAYEDQQMILRPLFVTAFLLDDFLADNDFFGARTVLLASASSKTALGLAFLLTRNRRSRCRVVGLTSPGNTAFVDSVGYYDRVISYDDVLSLPNDEPTTFVDMAGNGPVVSAIHRHYGDNVKHSAIVGMTHWERGERPDELPGAAPTFFFAPTQIDKRTKDWGPDGLQERIAGAAREFLGSTDAWLHLVPGHGWTAIEQVYRDMLEGRSKPSEGYVLSL
jgi:hypothetical protein